MILYASPRFAEHVTPPGHPERPERAEVFDAVAAEFARQGGSVRAPRPATREELARVHTAAYLDRIAATAGRAAMLDPDTFTSPESHEIALLAAGAAIDAARAGVADRRRPRWRSCVRRAITPRPDRAMGFCLYNNIAVAAAALRADGAARVAIVDIDVHHGNGTQAAFYADPTVLFVSSHQFPYYPGTGRRGRDRRRARARVHAERADAGGQRRRRLRSARTSTTIMPALERFRPDVDADLGRLRRARARSARRAAPDDGGLHGGCVALLDDAASRAVRPAASRSSPKAATTSRRSRECLESAIRVLD